MVRIFALVVLGGVAFGQTPCAIGQSQTTGVQPELKSASAAGDIPGLPPAPKGKSTIMGGEIRSVDPVRDVLTLKTFGQRAMKILYDERTQVYRDGKKISLRDLGPADHASVQTVLDGTDVYALSIHMLSQLPEGECQGRVLSFNPDTSELTLSSVLSREPLKLQVPAGTSVVRVGEHSFASLHPGSSDLVKGALISVQFKSGKQGNAVADHISVLATPGSAFVFIGNLTALDMHSGMMVLSDSLEGKTYKISFESGRLPTSEQLRLGDHVMVTADFNGTGYVANEIVINN
jgi:hypothetical protein